MMEGTSELEVNEILKTIVLQLIGDKLLFLPGGNGSTDCGREASLVNDVFIPALIQVEKWTLILQTSIL